MIHGCCATGGAGDVFRAFGCELVRGLAEIGLEVAHDRGEAIRDRLRPVLQANGYRTDEILPSRRILTLPTLTQPLIINAGSDVAALCQAVYRLRANEPPDFGLPIIAIVDQGTAARNPRAPDQIVFVPV